MQALKLWFVDDGTADDGPELGPFFGVMENGEQKRRLSAWLDPTLDPQYLDLATWDAIRHKWVDPEGRCWDGYRVSFGSVAPKTDSFENLDQANPLRAIEYAYQLDEGWNAHSFLVDWYRGNVKGWPEFTGSARGKSKVKPRALPSGAGHERLAALSLLLIKHYVSADDVVLSDRDFLKAVSDRIKDDLPKGDEA